MLDNIAIVLVSPTDPGNIGAAARAMRTMGLGRLSLVGPPPDYAGDKAQARASGAADLLRAATCHDTLESALAGCQLVIGTSARRRQIAWPELEPDAAAERLIIAAATGPVALVFGQERMGLTNAEMDRCHYVVTIPADPGYSSLNLGCAVQVLTYEIRRAARRHARATAPAATAGAEPLASAEDLRRLQGHLERILIDIGFLNRDHPRKLMRRLYRLFNRAGLSQNEVQILRGILTAVERLRRDNS